MLPRVARIQPATAIALVALFVALGGTSYAAVSITGKQVKDSSLTGKDVKRSSLTGSDVRNGSLTGGDVKDGSLTGADVRKGSVPVDRLSGRLPAGPAGPAGATGATGPAGPAGSPDTSRFYDRDAADARFAKGAATTTAASRTVAAGSTETLLAVPGWASVPVLNCNSSFANVGIVRDGAPGTSIWTETSTSPAGSSAGQGWSSAGSYSAPSGWVRYVVGGPGSSLRIEAHGRWDAAANGCSFVVTATKLGG